MDVTFLTEDQIFGDKALSVLKDYGTGVGYSDLAVLQSGVMSGSNKNIEGKRTGSVWSASADEDGGVFCVGCYDVKACYNPYSRQVAARPALPPSVTSTINPNEVRVLAREARRIEIAVWGEYPQTIAPPTVAAELDRLYGNDGSLLHKTGKKYTFDSRRYDEYGKAFKGVPYNEFELKNKRYIRVPARPRDNDSVLADGTKPEEGKYYWVEVKPIEWLKDKSGWWVAKEALFAGIRFNPEKYDGKFNKTEMKKYLDTYFANEMQSSRTYTPAHSPATLKAEVREEKAVTRRKNAYGVTVEQMPMSVTEQIDFYVQNGLSFMLHGPSGVGKTARVEQIDPDLTAVPLWNGVLPEDIVGKVRYPSGTERLPEEFLEALEKSERGNGQKDSNSNGADTAGLKSLLAARETEEAGVWTPPDWYNELCKKCAAEPDKQHVLFIDEVTNARPTTQSLIFHIVLKKSISPSKGKLPKNAVVVLAGNSKEESGAAYNMPEPLYRRMSSHIHLQPDLPDWLEWGSQPSFKHPNEAGRLNIHPLVSAFVSAQGRDVFYTPYDEETPPEFAMDPRGWEQVSDIIYNNKGVIRRELLAGKIGAQWTENLLAFAMNPPLSLEDILEGTYRPEDIPQNSDARLALTYNLRSANDRQVQKVRDFIGQNLGPEYQETFDSVWAGKDEERALLMGALRAKGGRS